MSCGRAYHGEATYYCGGCHDVAEKGALYYLASATEGRTIILLSSKFNFQFVAMMV